jgi:hypothetical protein
MKGTIMRENPCFRRISARIRARDVLDELQALALRPTASLAWIGMPVGAYRMLHPKNGSSTRRQVKRSSAGAGLR